MSGSSTVEVDFEYEPGRDSSLIVSESEGRAFGVLLELAAYVASITLPGRWLREIRFGTPARLDGERVYRGRADSAQRRVEVFSASRASGAANIAHLEAEIAAQAQGETGRQQTGAMPAWEMGALCAAETSLALAMRRAEAFLGSVESYEHGLVARIDLGSDDCAPYQVHPLAMDCWWLLVSCWCRDRGSPRELAPLWADSLQVLKPGARIDTIRLIRLPPTNADTDRLVLVAEEAGRVASLLYDLRVASREYAKEAQRIEPLQARKPSIGNESVDAGAVSLDEKSFLLATAAEALGLAQLDFDEDLIVAGATSLDLLRLLNLIERRWACSIDRQTFLEKPTLATLAALRATRAVTKDAAPATGMSSVNGTHTGEMTVREQQLWLLEQVAKVDGAYNEPLALRFAGELDAEALAQAYRVLIARHPALRCGFGVNAGAPFRFVRARVEPDLQVFDYNEHSSAESEALARRTLVEEVVRPFDLEHPPLVRALLIRLPNNASVFALVAHHIVIDEWSLSRVVLPELQALYAGFSQVEGQSGGLQAPFVATEDTAVQPVAYFEDPVREDTYAWWRQYLDGVPDSLKLFAGTSHPEEISYAGRTHAAALSKEAVSTLLLAARSEGVSAASAFIACFQVLLARITGTELFCIGTFAANRTSSAVEHVLGYFANLLPIRTDLRSSPTVRELLRNAYASVSAAVSHQEMPFAQIVSAARVARIPGVHPLVQAVIAMDDLPHVCRFGRVDGTRFEPDKGRAKFDLTVKIVTGDSDEGPQAYWEYRTDLFDAEVISCWAELFSTIIERMAFSLDMPVTELDLLSPTERRYLFDEVNATDKPESEHSVSEFVAQQVVRTPDFPAIVSLASVMTYRELGETVERIASALHRSGVPKGALVGVCVAREIELPAALLGTWRAGCAYVPMDPRQPTRRLHELVEDADISAIVCSDAATAARFPSRATIVLDDALAQPAAPLPVERLEMDDTAYVMYTSGTTGGSKGVIVSHRGLANLSCAFEANVGSPSKCAWLAVTTVTFDIAFLELIWPLTGGGTVLLHPGLASGADDLDIWTHRAEQVGLHDSITHLQSTPSGLQVLLNSDAGRRLIGRLDELFVGGEAFPVELARKAMGLTRARIWNMYGPTETTVWSSQHELRRVSAVVPIGRPLANTRFYVLSESGRLLPRGCPGELYIAGNGVGLGYIGKGELTRERFLEDTIAQNGQRMYRTGDIVRCSAAGEFEFLGRKDDQIKVSGFRVEPAEIERALLEHEAVQACAVVSRRINADAVLVAFVVLSRSDARVEELRPYLEQRLPSYMIPSVWAVRQSLPLTSSTKVDRAALSVEVGDRELRRGAVGPRNATEATLLEIWRTELRMPTLGILDDFFQVGGSSILAIAIVSRIRSELQCELQIETFVECRTVDQLAKAVEALRTGVPLRHDIETASRRKSRPVSLLNRRLQVAKDGTVDAVAVATSPEPLLQEVVARLADGKDGALWAALLETEWGRIGLLLIPLSASQVYRSSELLALHCANARDLARALGAHSMSLTGLIPSATEYGARIVGGEPDVRITTGHATTCAAVLLTLQGLLGRVRRGIGEERVAFVGLGSVGTGVLRLLLQTLEHPRTIVLCDIPRNRSWLLALEQELRGPLGFRGELTLSIAGTSSFESVYEASLVVGATNLPGVLDVARLRPGCLVVDDSAPHCFVIEAAVERMRSRADVVLSQAGAVRSRAPVQITFGGPWISAERVVPWIDAAFGDDEREIMGCTLSALMSADAHGLDATIGRLDPRASVNHRRWLQEHGMSHGPFRIGPMTVTDEVLDRFTEEFGG